MLDPEELESRFATLEAAMRRCERERTLGAASTRPSTPEANSPEPVSSGRAIRATVDDPVFEEAVRDVLERLESERAKERAAERLERRRATAERWSGDLGQRLGLSDVQKSKLTELAVEYNGRIQEMWRADAGAEPVRPTERRERMQSLRTEYEQRLSGVLDGRQMNDYRALGEEYRLGPALGRVRRPPGE
jgi:hypothetical protein